MPALARPLMTADEFLAWEREQPERHEFVGGEILGLAGASLAHGRIVFNLAKILDRACDEGGCAVFLDGAKLRVEGNLFYPDVMVSCEGYDIDGDLLGAPVLIAEVLSGSTELHDRGVKWAYYQRLGALETYMLVAQDRVFVEVFRRDGGVWTYASFTGLESTIELGHPACRVRVGELYSGISGRR